MLHQNRLKPCAFGSIRDGRLEGVLLRSRKQVGVGAVVRYQTISPRKTSTTGIIYFAGTDIRLGIGRVGKQEKKQTAVPIMEYRVRRRGELVRMVNGFYRIFYLTMTGVKNLDSCHSGLLYLHWLQLHAIMHVAKALSKENSFKHTGL